MHNRKAKTIAAFLCIIVIIVTFFPLLFITKEIRHECTGKDCPVCADVHRMEQTLREMGDGVAKAAVSLPVLLVDMLIFSVFLCFVPCIILISQKVRLDN